MTIPPEDIGTDMPLFGEGLALDSIDALEIVLELHRSFGVEVTDEQMGQRVLRSVRTIVEFIESQRAQAG
jgi:acyl carrier protein